MIGSGESLLSLKNGMRKLPQTMINVPISAAFELTQCAPALAESERVEALLAGRGRLVLRPSGTEPVIRVMIEGKDAAENLQLAEGIAEVIRQAI